MLINLLFFSTIPTLLTVVFALKTKFYIKKEQTKPAVLSAIISTIFAILLLATIWDVITINESTKFPLNNYLAEYHIYCGSYYQLEYRSDTKSESIAIATAPDNLNDFCDEKLIQIEGRIGPFYGPPICTNFSDDPKQIEKCENSHIPVVHLTKIESLTNPPTYPEK